MVQVLPYVPSPLEQLTPAISQAAGAIGAGIGSHYQQKRIQQNERILADPNASAVQKAAALASMPKGYKEHTSPIWAAVLGPQAQTEANANQIADFYGQRQQSVPAQPNNADASQPVAEASTRMSRNKLESMPEEELIAMNALGGPSEKLASAEMKRREGLWNYKPTQDFIKEINDRALDASKATEVADEFIKLASSGEISPSNLRNFAAARYGEDLPFLYTGPTAQAKLLEKLQASGLKEIFPRPSEKEFFFINSAQAQLGKTDAANIAVAQLGKKFSEIPIRAAQFADEVIKENAGVPPRDIQSQVRKKMDAYKKSLIDEAASVTFENGDISQRKQAAKFLHTKNLPLTEDKEKEIFIMAGRDAEKALKLAQELGYKIPQGQP